MSYKLVDEILIPWAKDNNIQIFTMDRDWEIRSFTIKNKFKYLISFPKGDEIMIKKFNSQSKQLVKENKLKLCELKNYLVKEL